MPDEIITTEDIQNTDGFLDEPTSGTTEPTTTPDAGTDNHAAFAELNRKYRESANEIKILKKQNEELAAKMNAGTTTAPSAPQPADVQAPSENKDIAYIAEFYRNQQAEQKAQQTRFDTIQKLSEMYKWDSQTATRFGNNPTLIKEIDQWSKNGNSATDIAFMASGKYSKSFSGQKRTNQTPGTNVNPLTNSTENPRQFVRNQNQGYQNPYTQQGYNNGLRQPTTTGAMTEAEFLKQNETPTK